MTRTEKVARMAELKSLVETGVKVYNTAILEKRYDDAATIDADIQKNVGEYGELAQNVTFIDMMESPEGPMMAAVKALSYVSLAVKDVKTKEDGKDAIPKREVIEPTRPIDLIKLEKFCTKGTLGETIGADKNWLHMVQKMNFHLTARVAKELGVDPKTFSDSYAMSEIARGIQLGNDPTSNTKLLGTLQSIVDAMLGDGYKVTSHDVRFLREAYSRKSRKALTITVANHSKLTAMLSEVCHHIVTGDAYNVDGYKIAKDKDAASQVEIVNEGKKADKAKATTKKAA